MTERIKRARQLFEEFEAGFPEKAAARSALEVKDLILDIEEETNPDTKDVEVLEQLKTTYLERLLTKVNARLKSTPITFSEWSVFAGCVDAFRQIAPNDDRLDQASRDLLRHLFR